MKYYFSKNYNVVWQNPCLTAWLKVCNVLGQISKCLSNPGSQDRKCKMEIPCHDILATAIPRGLNIKLPQVFVLFQTNWTWYSEVHTFSFLTFTEKLMNTQETSKIGPHVILPQPTWISALQDHRKNMKQCYVKNTSHTHCKIPNNI